jgi:hypothetical protein
MTVIIYSIRLQASFSRTACDAISASRMHATGASRAASGAARNNFVHPSSELHKAGARALL